jgi:hypothetical protein
MEDEKIEFQIQVRGEDIRFVSSMSEAIMMAIKDPTIWKISFALPTGERVRLVWRHGHWVYEDLVGAVLSEITKGI